MDTPVRLSLTETGTRYAHYMELRDTFATGVEILKNVLEVHRSISDVVRLKSLENAVELITSRVNYLSEFETKASPRSDLAKEVRAAGIHRTMELAVVSESTREACEKELAEAAKSGYTGDTDAEDRSTKNSENNQGQQAN